MGSDNERKRFKHGGPKGQSLQSNYTHGFCCVRSWRFLYYRGKIVINTSVIMFSIVNLTYIW